MTKTALLRAFDKFERVRAHVGVGGWCRGRGAGDILALACGRPRQGVGPFSWPRRRGFVSACSL